MLDRALLLRLTRVPELIFNFAFSFTSLPSTPLVFLTSLSLPLFKEPTVLEAAHLGTNLRDCGQLVKSVKHAVMYTTCNFFLLLLYQPSAGDSK